MTGVVKPENLGPEFDLGNIQGNRIRLKAGAGLTIDLGGTVKAPYDPRLSNLESMLRDRHVLPSKDVDINTTNTYLPKISETITVDGGDYDVCVSYGWNGDTTTGDFRSRFLIDGLPVDVTTTALHQQEPKDSAGNPAASDPIDLTRTDQAFAFTRVFHNVPLTAGDHSVLLEWSSSVGGAEASIWGAEICIKRTNF